MPRTNLSRRLRKKFIVSSIPTSINYLSTLIKLQLCDPAGEVRFTERLIDISAKNI